MKLTSSCTFHIFYTQNETVMFQDQIGLEKMKGYKEVHIRANLHSILISFKENAVN